MPSYLQNFGLGFMEEEENEETLEAFLLHAAEEGVPITGYFDLPYLNHHYGDIQMIFRTAKAENEKLNITGFDTHCKGRCVWDLQIIDELSGNEDPLSKRLLLKGADGKGLFIVNVVNADVLPSFSEDEVIRLQMVAYADEIHFYENEEAYSRTVKPGTNGIRISVGKNTIFPSGLLANTDNDATKEIVQIHGTIKHAYWGNLKLDEDTESQSTFIYCQVQTQCGELDIVMDAEKIDPEQGKFIKEGCLADCFAVLCGDAGIFELEEGIVKDAESNLKLVRYTLEKGDPERMRSVMAKNFVYHSEAAGKHIEDKDEYISFVNLVHQKGDKCNASYAILDEYAGEKEPEYPAGTHCLVLRYGKNENYSAIVFVNTDEDGNIARIYLSVDSNYRFTVESKKRNPDEEIDIKPIMDSRERLMGRAHFLCLFSRETETETVDAKLEEHRDEIMEELKPLLAEESPDAETIGKAFLMGARKSTVKELDEKDLMEIGAQLFRDLTCFMEDEDKDNACREYLPFIMAMGILYEGKVGEHE